MYIDIKFHHNLFGKAFILAVWITFFGTIEKSGFFVCSHMHVTHAPPQYAQLYVFVPMYTVEAHYLWLCFPQWM